MTTCSRKSISTCQNPHSHYHKSDTEAESTKLPLQHHHYLVHGKQAMCETLYVKIVWKEFEVAFSRHDTT